jgi:hypothetical protein
MRSTFLAGLGAACVLAFVALLPACSAAGADVTSRS